MKSDEIYDCIIIGGGPAGLTAGIYLARYRCNILIIDDNQSRANLIPCSHNYPAFPQGISGKEILKRMKQQYENYGAPVVNAHVDKLEYDSKSQIFSVISDSFTKYAKKIILATGVLDIEPALPNLKNGILNGLIRHCIICDGYEVIGKRIAIISDSEKGANEALFLSTYSKDITLFNINNNVKISRGVLTKLKDLKIPIIQDAIDEVILTDNVIVAFKTAKQDYHFDSLYSALGCKIRSSLVIELGAKHIDSYVTVDEKQETSIPGVYAIGDVVEGLNQICVASSQAAIAATAIFRTLKNLD